MCHSLSIEILLTWQRTVVRLLLRVAAHVRFQSIPARMVALLALTLAPLAHIFCLFRPIRRAMQVLHVVHQLVVVLRRAPRAVPPLTLGLRILSDGVLVVRWRTRRVAPAVRGQ
jgi:hypothetical protein